MRLCVGVLVLLSLVACVDGKTPDCSTPASGCFPEDAASSNDASDAAGDAAKDDASDAAAPDAASDAADAAD